MQQEQTRSFSNISVPVSKSVIETKAGSKSKHSDDPRFTQITRETASSNVTGVESKQPVTNEDPFKRFSNSLFSDFSQSILSLQKDQNQFLLSRLKEPVGFHIREDSSSFFNDKENFLDAADKNNAGDSPPPLIKKHQKKPATKLNHKASKDLIKLTSLKKVCLTYPSQSLSSQQTAIQDSLQRNLDCQHH